MPTDTPVQLSLPGFSPLSIFADSHGIDYVSCVYVHMLFDDDCLLTPYGVAVATEELRSWDVYTRNDFVELVTQGLNTLRASFVVARAIRRMREGSVE